MTIPAPLDLLRQPGVGVGWMRVAQALAEHLPPEEIDGIWLFQPVRREDREWGVAVVAGRTGTERRRIYTASYMLVVRGRDRGECKLAVEQVGESPSAVLQDVIAGVQRRAGEPEPPVAISPALWYPPDEQDPSDPNGAPSVSS